MAIMMISMWTFSSCMPCKKWQKTPMSQHILVVLTSAKPDWTSGYLRRTHAVELACC